MTEREKRNFEKVWAYWERGETWVNNLGQVNATVFRTGSSSKETFVKFKLKMSCFYYNLEILKVKSFKVYISRSNSKSQTSRNNICQHNIWSIPKLMAFYPKQTPQLLLEIKCEGKSLKYLINSPSFLSQTEEPSFKKALTPRKKSSLSVFLLDHFSTPLNFIKPSTRRRGLMRSRCPLIWKSAAFFRGKYGLSKKQKKKIQFCETMLRHHRGSTPIC